MADNEYVVKLEGVSRLYHQGEQTVHALDHVSLGIQPGDMVVVAGPSGSGKTTLLNIAGGLDRPTEGRVWLKDHALNSMGRRSLAQLRLRAVGFVFQAYNLIPVLSAEENAEFVLLLRGVSASARRAKVRAALKAVGLQGMENRRPHQLSGGQQQRVAVARAIVAEPALVLADEPTANLDSTAAAALLDMMVQLNLQLGTTFLFSTHDPRVMQRARRVIKMMDGRIVDDEVVPEDRQALCIRKLSDA